MAEKTPADVINAHHDKLNEHTSHLADLERRVDALEAEHKPIKDFVQRMNDWVGKIKDLV